MHQGPTRRAASLAPCSLALSSRSSGLTSLWCTISAELRAQLGWEVGQLLQLQVGRGADAGQVRIVPADTGRRLRTLPRSAYCSVELMPPPDLAAWQAARMPAEHGVMAAGRGKAGTGPVGLAVVLPWGLPHDRDGMFLPPPPAEPEDLAA